MKIIFASIDSKVSDALAKHFDDADNVEVHHGDIFRHKADAIVSPSNSLAFMDGGIDLAYSKHFGWDLEKRLQKVVRDQYDGELLVGQAVVIPTKGGEDFDPENEEIPWLISAPTMRVPMHITGTVNVFLAFRAALRAAVRLEEVNPERRDKIQSVLSPGMGTGVGNMDPDIAAAQMKLAYLEVLRGVELNQPGVAAAYRLHHLIARGMSSVL